jgi:hypothetical protein
MVLLFEEMDVVKAFSHFFVLFFEPVSVAYSLYSGVAIVYLVGCFLVTELLAFLKILAKIAIFQAFSNAASSNFAIRHSTAFETTDTTRISKPIQPLHEVSKLEILGYMLYPISILVGLDKPLQLFCHPRNTRMHPTMTAADPTVTYR